MSETTNCPKCGSAAKQFAEQRAVAERELQAFRETADETIKARERQMVCFRERAEAAEKERDGARTSREYAETRLMHYGEQHNADVNRLLEKVAALEARAEAAERRCDSLVLDAAPLGEYRQ